MIIHERLRGGLGHKSTSLLHSITYALLLHRPLRIIMPSSYWDSTNSCLKKLIYRENINNIRVCSAKNSCVKQEKNLTTLFEEPLLFKDYWGIPAIKSKHFSPPKSNNNSLLFRNWDEYVKHLLFIIITFKWKEYHSPLTKNTSCDYSSISKESAWRKEFIATSNTKTKNQWCLLNKQIYYAIVPSL